MFLHRHGQRTSLQPMQAIIKEICRNYISFPVLAIDLEHQDPAFIFAGNNAIDLVVGGKPNMGGVELNYIRQFFTIPIEFDGVAVNHALSLVLVNSIKKIVVWEEINIDQPVAWDVILLHLRYRLHVV